MRRIRSAIGWPRSSAIPCSVAIKSASPRAVVTGPLKRATMREIWSLRAVEGSAITERPSRRKLHAANEIALAANRADILARRHFGIDLASQIDFDSRVDRDNLALPREDSRVVRIVKAHQPDRAVMIGKIEEAAGANQAARNGKSPGQSPCAHW